MLHQQLPYAFHCAELSSNFWYTNQIWAWMMAFMSFTGLLGWVVVEKSTKAPYFCIQQAQYFAKLPRFA